MFNESSNKFTKRKPERTVKPPNSSAEHRLISNLLVKDILEKVKSQK